MKMIERSGGRGPYSGHQCCHDARYDLLVIEGGDFFRGLSSKSRFDSLQVSFKYLERRGVDLGGPAISDGRLSSGVADRS